MEAIMSLPYYVHTIAYVLVIIGALNWGLVGLLGLDVIARLFGGGSLGAKIMYILIGASGLLMLLR
jgi:uncharacterized membrane protein YuzA (DUF378 family)